MPFTQADLDALDSARKQGAKRIRFQDRDFEFDTVDDYIKLRHLIVNDIAQSTASMYDRSVGPQVHDVVPDPLPGMFWAIPLGPMWAPYQIEAPSNDALFPGEWTFDSDQTYTSLADGTALAYLAITGKLPVNQFSPGVGGPAIGRAPRAGRSLAA